MPNHPGQFSAYGFIMTNARVDRQRTTQLTSRRFDPARAAEVMETLVREGVAELAEQGYIEGIEAYRALEMRYLGQNYELELPVGPERSPPATTERLWRAFHEAHAARFGFSMPGEIIEIVNYTATVVSRTAKPELLRLPRPARAIPSRWRAGRSATRAATHEVPVFRREALRGGPPDRRPGGGRGGGLGDDRQPGPAPDGRPVRPPDHRRGRLREAGRCGSPRTATTSRST